MPCSMVATVSSKLAVDPSIIASSEVGTKALATVIAKQLEVDPSQVTVRKNSFGGLSFYNYPFTIILTKTGELQVTHSYSQREAARVQQALAPTITELAGLLTQQKVQAAIKARFNVTQQQRTSNGSVVLTLNV